MNNKGCFGIGTVGLVLIGAIALVIFWGIGIRNGFVGSEQNVNEKWANVETVYQKRANLIPNLERTVKSYAKFEQETLTKVIEARSKATQVTIDPTNMTEADLAKFQAKTKLIVAQYSKFEPLPGKFVNGDATQGENIADLGGVVMGLEAFKKTAQYKNNDKKPISA